MRGMLAAERQPTAVMKNCVCSVSPASVVSVQRLLASSYVRALHPRAEPDVAPQVEAVGDVIEVRRISAGSA